MSFAQISFAPLLPAPVLAALALLAVIAWLLAIRARGAWVRGGGFLFLLMVLSGPHWTSETLAPLPDIALVLVDHSQSMAIGQRNAMAARALSALRASAGKTSLRVIDMLPADVDGTALFTALHNALAAIPAAQLAGIIAITDGQIADAAPATLPAPLSTLITAAAPETDRELRLLSAPAFGLVGQPATLRFEVLDHGLNNYGAPATLTVTEDGQQITAQQVAVGEVQNISLPVTHAGPSTITAAVSPLAGEVSRINNQAAFTINGVQKRLNILLISGSPSQSERSWRVLLKSDPAVQAVHFTILRDPGESIDADPRDLALVPFPISQLFETDLEKFDLIIMDQFVTAGLLPPDYVYNITNYVQNGGALLATFGPEFETGDSLAYNALGAILPAIPADPGTISQDFRPAVTVLGARHPVTAPFANMALPSWYRIEAATPAPGGSVLMSGAQGAPLLILAPASKGRVGILLSDQFWLWTRGGAHDGPALPLLRRIVHWLLREPDLEPESLNASINYEQLSIVRQTLSAAYPGNPEITGPDGKMSSISLQQTAPGHYAASLPAAEFGVWKISEAGLTAYAVNNAVNAQEYQDLAATDTIMRPVSRTIIWLGQTPALALDNFLIPRHATQITGTRDFPILPPFPVMLAAIILLFAAWWRESR